MSLRSLRRTNWNNAFQKISADLHTRLAQKYLNGLLTPIEHQQFNKVIRQFQTTLEHMKRLHMYKDISYYVVADGSQFLIYNKKKYFALVLLRRSFNSGNACVAVEMQTSKCIYHYLVYVRKPFVLTKRFLSPER